MTSTKFTCQAGNQLLLCVCIILLTVTATASMTQLSPEPVVYLDPSLAATNSEVVSVIATALDMETAVSTINNLGGQVTSELWLIDSVAASLTAQQLQQLASSPNITSIVANKGVRVSDDGCGDSGGCGDGGWGWLSPQPSAATVDIGANQVYEQGRGMTIAVIDSGVYFTNQSWEFTSLGYHMEENRFLGQADFVGEGQCVALEQFSLAAEDQAQHDDYCFSDSMGSPDPFGHGSHVAGLIGNTRSYDYQRIGIAPEAKILSVRVLDEQGEGTYEDVIEGIQYVVANKNAFGVRIMNLSLSSEPTTPYFIDPVNRAVEAAWADGIVVVAAAGNTGTAAESITVPGNDPYIITVGAISSSGTTANWSDDVLAPWSSTGPTYDGFIKPDILAPGSKLVSFTNESSNSIYSSELVRAHGDNYLGYDLFQMSGTSVATAVTSGAIALILEAHPHLTPDEVKTRLMATARTAVDDDTQEPLYNVFQQGAGRIWVLDAIESTNIPTENANEGLDILADLAHPWSEGDSLDPASNPDLDFHSQGPVQTTLSDDGSTYLYYVVDDDDGTMVALGAADANTLAWLDAEAMSQLNVTFDDGGVSWGEGYVWAGGTRFWSGGTRFWSGGTRFWSGGTRFWSGGTRFWSGGTRFWSGGTRFWSGGTRFWSGNAANVTIIDPATATMSKTNWVE